MLAALTVAACGKENHTPETPDGPETPETAVKEMTFSATFSPLTRASLAEDLSLLWVRNDEVGVFDGEGNRSFKAKSTGAKTDLAGEALEGKTYYALFPYDKAATLDGTAVKTSVPADQTASRTDVTGFPVLAVAQASDGAMAFTTLTGVLKFTFAEDAGGITGLEIRAASEASLAGDVTIDFGGAAPAATASGGKGYLYVKPAESAFKAGETYYVEALPGIVSAGFILTAYRGSAAAETVVAGPVTVKAGAVTDLGTVSGTLNTNEKAFLGRWQVVRYGSRDVDDPDGKHVWYSDVNEKSLYASIDDIVEFKADGTVEIDLGADGHTYNVGAEEDVTVDLDGTQTWEVLEEDGQMFLQFGGGGVPGILVNAQGIDAKYKVASLGAGGITLEIFRTNADGDSWFLIDLQPVGVKTYSHKFADGDFGVTGSECYKLNVDSRTGESELDGVVWTLDVDTDDVFYSWSGNAGLRIGIGNWRDEAFTPKVVTLSTKGIPGTVKAVKVKTAHNTSDDTQVELMLGVTVGDAPFGTRYPVLHDAAVYNFTSLQAASGEIVITWTRNKGLYGMFLQSVEGIYQED